MGSAQQFICLQIKACGQFLVCYGLILLSTRYAPWQNNLLRFEFSPILLCLVQRLQYNKHSINFDKF